MGVGAILIVFSVFIGSKERYNNQNKLEDSVEQNENDKTMENVTQYQKVKQIRSTDKNEIAIKDETGGKVNKPMDGDYEGFEEIVPQKVDESQFPPTYQHMYGKESVAKSKEIAKEFVKIFYNFNGKYPLEYVEASKKYMTVDFYNRWQQQPEQGTISKMYRKIIHTEIFEPFDTPETTDEIIWIAKIEGEILDYHKKKSERITEIYTLLLRKEDKEWRVADLLINAPF